MEADKLRAEFQKSIQKWEVWLERLGGESRIDLRGMSHFVTLGSPG